MCHKPKSVFLLKPGDSSSPARSVLCKPLKTLRPRRAVSSLCDELRAEVEFIVAKAREEKEVSSSLEAVTEDQINDPRSLVLVSIL